MRYVDKDDVVQVDMDVHDVDDVDAVAAEEGSKVEVREEKMERRDDACDATAMTVVDSGAEQDGMMVVDKSGRFEEMSLNDAMVCFFRFARFLIIN